MQSVEIRGMDKRFGATQALDDVTIGFAPGQITGLVGSNGAGKSTVIKVLAGIVRADRGEILVDGEHVTITSPLTARALGIEVVHQNVDDLVTPGLTVAENLVLDTLGAPGSDWFVTKRSVRRRAASVAANIGLDVDLDLAVESCTASERQMVALARALQYSPKLLILDEPTAALSDAESSRLFDVVRTTVREHPQVSVVFVSHHLQEIEELCNRVVVMRDGRIVLDTPMPIPRTEMVESILGRVVADLDVSEREAGPVAASLRQVAPLPTSPPFDIDLRHDEVVGLFGLIGAGKSELLRQLYGLEPLEAGELRIQGEPYVPRSPRTAIAAGVVYVPEERGALALIDDWSVTDNIALPYLDRCQAPTGLLSKRRRDERLVPIIERMSIKCESPDAVVSSLSGGNQQKAVVGRWMQEPVALMLLDEPFRGIDIGARHDIVRLLRDTASTTAVMVACADPEEIREVADRIIVLASGRCVADVRRSDVDADQLVRLAAS